MSKTRTRWLAGRLFEIVALVLIVTALVVQLGRLLAPYVNDNRGRIESYLTEQLGSPVRIGDIEARWEGLRPQLTVSDIVVHNSDDLAVLRIQQAQVQVGLLRSLRDLALRMQHVALSGVRLSLDQTATGGWQLSGFSPPAKPKTPFDPVNALLFSRYVDFDEVHAHFHFQSGLEQQVGFSQMRLENDNHFHRLVADVDLSGQPSDVMSLVYEGYGDPRDGDNFKADSYLKLDHYPLSNAVAFVSETAATHVGVQDGLLSAELWLKTRPQQPTRLQGRVHFERTTAVEDDIPLRASADVLGSWSSPSSWNLNLQDLQATWSDRQTELLSIGIRSGAEQQSWRVNIPLLDLSALAAVLLTEHEATDTWRNIIADLAPAGALRQVEVTVPKASPKDFVLRANLQQVSVQAWKGAPGVEHLNGYVEASALSGLVEIDTQADDPNRPFSLYFPQVYDQPLEFERGQGIVSWDVRPDQDQVLVHSGPLSLQGNLGDANGYFYLDAPLQRHARPIELMLQIGLQNAHGSAHQKLVPRFLPQSLLKWLDTAVVDGEVTSGGFLLAGFFGEDTGYSPSVQVALNIEGGQLQFDHRWPLLEDFNGFVYIDDQRVHGWVDGGQFVQSQLQPTYVEVSDNPNGTGPLLQIHGAVSGPAQAGLAILTETPIHDVLGTGLDDWQLHGDLQASVQLHIPLKEGEPGSRQQVAVSLQEAALTMQGLNLHFSSVHGDLSYTDQQGLHGKSLSAHLWGQPLQLSIASSVASGASMNTAVSFSGPVNFAELATWSQRPEALFVEGTVPVSGVVNIGSGSVPVNIQVSSDLQGASINLPAPYGKTAAEKRPLVVNIPVARERVNYRFEYGSHVLGDDAQDSRVSVNLEAQPGQPVTGVVTLGQTSPQYRSDDGLLLAGNLDTLDVSQWLPVVSRYQSFSQDLKTKPANSGSSGLGEVAAVSGVAPRLQLDVRIEKFLWGELELQTLQVEGGQQANGWRIQVDDERLKGTLHWLNNDSPMQLAMDYIHWPAAQSKGAGAPKNHGGLGAPQGDNQERSGDFLSGYRPQDVPAFDFSVADLSLGGKNLGRWSFQARPDEEGLKVGNLVGLVDGVQVSAIAPADDNSVSGATLWWQQRDGKHSSQFHGKLSGGNLADISAAWGLPPMMESKTVELDAELLWAGSPVSFSLATLQGDMKLKVTDGRFYRSTGQASDALLRLVGLFNFDSWIRRLKLDFSDVVKGGTPFERVKGKLQFDRGMVYLSDPVEVKNTSSVLKMGGKIDLRDETLDTSLVATLPVGGNATLIAALAGGLPAAAGVYVISKIFKKQMDRMASVSYSIKGSWSNPDIEFDKLFDNKAAEEATHDSREQARETPSP